MTPTQKMLIETSFAKIVPIAPVAAKLFYNRLFELDPDLRHLFRDDLVEQGRKLMKMLTYTVNKLDKLDELLPALENLGERHAQYGVKIQDYQTVGEALIWTLEQGLKEDFTLETREAWLNAYTLIASTMLAAATRLARLETQPILLPVSR